MAEDLTVSSERGDSGLTRQEYVSVTDGNIEDHVSRTTNLDSDKPDKEEQWPYVLEMKRQQYIVIETNEVESKEQDEGPQETLEEVEQQALEEDEQKVLEEDELQILEEDELETLEDENQADMEELHDQQKVNLIESEEEDEVKDTGYIPIRQRQWYSDTIPPKSSRTAKDNSQKVKVEHRLEKTAKPLTVEKLPRPYDRKTMDMTTVKRIYTTTETTSKKTQLLFKPDEFGFVKMTTYIQKILSDGTVHTEFWTEVVEHIPELVTHKDQLIAEMARLKD